MTRQRIASIRVKYPILDIPFLVIYDGRQIARCRLAVTANTRVLIFNRNALLAGPASSWFEKWSISTSAPMIDGRSFDPIWAGKSQREPPFPDYPAVSRVRRVYHLSHITVGRFARTASRHASGMQVTQFSGAKRQNCIAETRATAFAIDRHLHSRMDLLARTFLRRTVWGNVWGNIAVNIPWTSTTRDHVIQREHLDLNSVSNWRLRN